MKNRAGAHRVRKWGAWAAIRPTTPIGGCGSGQKASRMTSFSAQISPSQTPKLFTIPQDRMSHPLIEQTIEHAS